MAGGYGNRYAGQVNNPAMYHLEWTDMDQLARDEKSDEEEREYKAPKNREKKHRKMERLRREASEKVATAAIKKQEKLTTSWKSHILAACLTSRTMLSN
jgi:hypothetical protein